MSIIICSPSYCSLFRKECRFFRASKNFLLSILQSFLLTHVILFRGAAVVLLMAVCFWVVFNHFSIFFFKKSSPFCLLMRPLLLYTPPSLVPSEDYSPAAIACNRITDAKLTDNEPSVIRSRDLLVLFRRRRRLIIQKLLKRKAFATLLIAENMKIRQLFKQRSKSGISTEHLLWVKPTPTRPQGKTC